MVSKWNYVSPLTEEEKHTARRLADALSISPAICTLLVQRGIKTEEQVKKFFRPRLEDLHDPFLLKDMDKAVARLNKAMGAKEKILIYGDYDVDGTTAVALVYRFLNNFYSNIDYYIPDRYDEGYGISIKGIDYAAENGFSLVITLDCGIKAVEKIAYAREKGIDFIVCDHHVPDEHLPQAVAVLDAKRDDDTYPYEHLSGCGVGFKFMQAFALDNDIDIEQHLFPLLDLLAVSIASDIVPITGENRILAYHGLKRLNTNPSLGLQGIINVCGLHGKDITISDIVFKIGPRINRARRRWICWFRKTPLSPARKVGTSTVTTKTVKNSIKKLPRRQATSLNNSPISPPVNPLSFTTPSGTRASSASSLRGSRSYTTAPPSYLPFPTDW